MQHFVKLGERSIYLRHPARIPGIKHTSADPGAVAYATRTSLRNEIRMAIECELPWRLIHGWFAQYR